MNEIIDQNEWKIDEEYNLSDIDLDDEEDKLGREEVKNEESNSKQDIQELKSQQNEKVIAILSNNQLEEQSSKVKFNDTSYIRESFGFIQQDDYTSQLYYNPQNNPSSSSPNFRGFSFQDYQEALQIYSNDLDLEKSIICTGENKYENKNAYSSYPNQSKINMINDLNQSFLPDILMCKSHLDQLNRGNNSQVIEKKKKIYNINITSYEKVQTQLNPYIVYIINSSWSDSVQEYKHVAKRRFNEFKCLNRIITKKYLGFTQPSFPDSSIQETLLPVIKYIKEEDDYLQVRQKKLDNYLKRLALTPFILGDEYFEKFLSLPEEFKVEYDEEKEKQTIIKSYFSSIQGIFSNFKNLIYSQETPYLSDQDKEQQDRLNEKIIEIQDQKKILLTLKNEFLKISFDELKQFIKNGEAAAETELTQIDQQNIKFQQEFLSNYYKQYMIQSEQDVTDKIADLLETIIEMLNDAEKSLENYNLSRNQLIQKILEEKLQNLNIKDEDKINKLVEETKDIAQEQRDENGIIDNSWDIQLDQSQQQSNINNIFENTITPNSNSRLEQQYFLEIAGTNLIKEFSNLLSVILPQKIEDFSHLMRNAYSNHYEKDVQIQFYNQTLIND